MQKEVQFEVRFKLEDNEIERLKEIIDEMQDILAEKQYNSIKLEELEEKLEKIEEESEEHKEIQGEIKQMEEEEERLDQQLEKLEKEFKEILGISYEMTVLYGHNDGLIRYFPSLIVSDVDAHRFWIDISPKVSIHFYLSDEEWRQ
ncbi:hypothetical protein N617_gp01 [Stygiolobus rod-shaped virus]|uniref:Uncharacterized protein n=1 Tax=Stygiolobus rod-shaped virus TaxID=537009 RepID=B6EFA7_9VIRU|nr:hypothetical protein N617_gp01 [Stygiolobus rod-shaped virus]CAQ58442.1 hypothetical protein [Stygiolobus rod-shaped virus]